MFFSEEKNQKTFTSGARGQVQAMATQCEAAEKYIKVFCFFSSEKKTFLKSPFPGRNFIRRPGYSMFSSGKRRFRCLEPAFRPA